MTNRYICRRSHTSLPKVPYHTPVLSLESLPGWDGGKWAIIRDAAVALYAFAHRIASYHLTSHRVYCIGC